MSGWGVSTPGAGADHGVADIIYGDGTPLGDPDTVVEVDIPPTPETIDVRVRITRKDDSFVVILQGDVLFDTDKSDIKKEAGKPLTQAASIVNSARRAGGVVLINGHTDDVGGDDYNLGLSERRATAAAQWFVTHKLLPASIIKTQGFGKTQPAIPKTDEASRAKNRRIEIYVINR